VACAKIAIAINLINMERGIPPHWERSLRKGEKCCVFAPTIFLMDFSGTNNDF
jgi:hypothetical protein